MAVTSNRSTTITYTSDFTAAQTIAAAQNTSSPGSVTTHTLSSGANTITVPTGGSTVKGATIVPPTTNVQTIILKGVTGDTGVGLHATDYSSISLVSGQTTFCLTAGGTITGLKIYWS